MHYQYIMGLSQAIGDLVAAKQAACPTVFLHRGADLRFAVERTWFSAHAGNVKLASAFQCCLDGKPPARLAVRTVDERDVAVQLFRPVASGVQVELQHRPAIPWRAAVRSVLRCGQAALRMLRPSQNLAGRPRLLICLNHAKFIRYLAPVTDRLSGSYAFFPMGNRHLRRLLSQRNLPWADVLAGRSLPGTPGTDISRKFPVLAAAYDRLLATMLATRPDCLLVIEGSAPDNEVANRVGEFLQVPVICIQQGWAPLIHTGYRNMSFTKMLVWGEGFAELLQPFNPRQRFVATGSPVLGHAENTAVPRQDPAAKGVCFFLQTPSILLTAEGWRRFLGLIGQAAEEFPMVPVLVREHPGRELSPGERGPLVKLPNVRFCPPHSHSLAEVFRMSRLSVAIYSSTILESVLAGVVPVIVNLTSLPEYSPNVAAEGAGVEVKCVADALAAIRRLLTAPDRLKDFEPAMDRLSRRYFVRDGQHPADRIVAELLSAISEHARRSPVASSPSGAISFCN